MQQDETTGESVSYLQVAKSLRDVILAGFDDVEEAATGGKFLGATPRKQSSQ